ncbi:AaceriAER060Wp [[Ashbya] aceris (nom. inval.)]|nr:AaceriAER060Wp [[Ashbya] aceris (nom. inval.)]
MVIWRRYFSSAGRPMVFKKMNKALAQAAPREHVVRRLEQPVGMPQPPTATTRYVEGNSMLDMFSEEKTSRRAAELAAEFSKSGLYDAATFRKTNGKVFLPPASYWRAEHARYFPHLSGITLTGTRGSVEDALAGKVSVVKVFSCETGEGLASSYFRHEGHDYLREDDVAPAQIVEVSLTESWIKDWLVRLMTGRLRSLVPAARHERYFICRRAQLPFTVRESLELGNLYTGYVLVVDPQLKIRWMACGGAEKRDVELLWKCVRGVQREFSAS